MKTIVVFLVLLILLLLNKDYWKAKDYQIKPESFYYGIYYGTTDTGESAPIWSVRFMEKEAKALVEIVEGSGQINIVNRKFTEHTYNIMVESEKARVLENTLYFPGWIVYIDGTELSLNDVWFQDPNHRGLINFFLEKGKHQVKIVFKETKLRQIADIISVVSLIILFFIPWLRFPLPSQPTTKRKI